jgi:hypothetical protein
LGFQGLTPVNGQNLYPWSNTTFKLDLLKPFANYVNHLMTDNPSTNPIQLPNIVALGRSLQTFAAGTVIAFDPFTPGSGACPGACANLPAALDYPAIVKVIGNLWPGNTSIDSWLTAYANHTANVPTPAQIAKNIELYNKGLQFWDFGNKPLPNSSVNTGINPSSLAPMFHALWAALGLNPPPLAPAPLAPAQNAAPTGGSVNAVVSRSMLSRVGSRTTSTKAKGDDTKSEPPQVSGTPQGGEVTPPTTGLPLTGHQTSTGTTPSTGTGGKPGSLLRGVNNLLPHLPGTTTAHSGTETSNHSSTGTSSKGGSRG